jgi:hypothetical protein
MFADAGFSPNGSKALGSAQAALGTETIARE